MAIHELSNGAPDGWRAGLTASDKGAFFGATPVVQPASGSQAVFTVTATVALAATTLSQANVTTVFGFANSTVGALYLARVREMQVDVEGLGVLLKAVRAAMVTAGIMKGAA